jgi:hypothetical protein
MDPFAPAQHCLEQSGWKPLGGGSDADSVTAEYQKSGRSVRVRIDRDHMHVAMSSGESMTQPKTEDGGFALAAWLRQHL